MREFLNDIMREDEFDDLLVLAESSLKKIWENREDEIWDLYQENMR